MSNPSFFQGAAAFSASMGTTPQFVFVASQNTTNVSGTYNNISGIYNAGTGEAPPSLSADEMRSMVEEFSKKVRDTVQEGNQQVSRSIRDQTDTLLKSVKKSLQRPKDDDDDNASSPGRELSYRNNEGAPNSPVLHPPSKQSANIGPLKLSFDDREADSATALKDQFFSRRDDNSRKWTDTFDAIQSRNFKFPSALIVKDSPTMVSLFASSFDARTDAGLGNFILIQPPGEDGIDGAAYFDTNDHDKDFEEVDEDLFTAIQAAGLVHSCQFEVDTKEGDNAAICVASSNATSGAKIREAAVLAVGKVGSISHASFQSDSTEFPTPFYVDSKVLHGLLVDSEHAVDGRIIEFVKCHLDVHQSEVLAKSKAPLEFNDCTFADDGVAFAQAGAVGAPSKVPLMLEFKFKVPNLKYLKQAVELGYVKLLQFRKWRMTSAELAGLVALCKAAVEQGWTLRLFNSNDDVENDDVDYSLEKVLILHNDDLKVDMEMDVEAKLDEFGIPLPKPMVTKMVGFIFKLCCRASGINTDGTPLPVEAPRPSIENVLNEASSASNDSEISDQKVAKTKYNEFFEFEASDGTLCGWVRGKWVPTVKLNSGKMKGKKKYCANCKKMMIRRLDDQGNGRLLHCKKCTTRANPLEGAMDCPEEAILNN